MKRLAIILAALLGVVLAALLVAPRFIAWEPYKPQLLALASDLTGRPIAIDGTLDLALLPTPTLTASGVRVGRPGGQPGDAVRLKSLDARLSLGPLLGGRVVVRSVALIQPEVLAAEEFADVLAWETGDRGLRAGELGLESLIVVDGRVASDPDPAGQPEIRAINAEVVADPAAGTLRIAGEAVWRETPWRFELLRGRPGGANLTPLTLSWGLRNGAAALRLAGSVQPGAAGPEVTGRLRGEGPRPAELLAALGLAVPATLNQRFALDGQLQGSARRVALDQLTLSLGELRATGAAGVSFSPDNLPEFDATLEVPRIDFDRWDWNRALAPPVELPPPRLTGSVDLAVDAVQWRGGLIRQVRVDVGVALDAVVLRQASAQLPGGSDVVAYGMVDFSSGWRFDGAIEAGSENLRGVLSWLGLDTGIPADRLRRVTLTANLKADRQTIDVGNLDMSFDSSRLTGNFAVALRDRPAVGATLAIDRLNLDAYIPRDWNGGQPLAWMTRLDGTLQARIGAVTWRTLPLRDLAFDGTLRDGTLDLREFSVRGQGETDVARVSGTVARQMWPARIDLVASANVAEPDRLTRLLDLGWVPPALGTLTAQATLKGGTDQFALATEGTFGALRGQLQGSVDITREAGSLAFLLRHDETMSLARTLWPDYRPAELAIGPATLSGRLNWQAGTGRVERLDAQLGPTSVTGTAALDWSLDRPAVDIDLAANALTLDAYMDAARGWPSLSWLELGGLDGRFSLRLEALDIGRAGFGDVRLAGTLDANNLSVEEGRARVFVGALDLTATADRQPGAPTRVRAQLKDADIRQLAAAFLGAADHEGRLDLDLRMELPLGEPDPWAAATGEALVEARAGVLHGIDAGDLMRRDGRTPFTQASGRLALEKGVVRPVGLAIETPAGRLTPAGRVDLAAGTLDLLLGLSSPDRPPAGLRLTGPITHPQRAPER